MVKNYREIIMGHRCGAKENDIPIPLGQQPNQGKAKGPEMYYSVRGQNGVCFS